MGAPPGAAPAPAAPERAPLVRDARCSVTPAAVADPAATPVAYTVTPVVSAGRLTRLAVALRFCGDADGETRLVLPREWAGVDSLWRHISGLAVEGALAVAPDGDAARLVRHRPGAPLVVRYVVGPADSTAGDPGGAFEKARPVVRPGWFFFHGEGVFAAPEGREDAPARFAWGRLPAGWRVASDLDHVVGGGPASVGTVRESVALGAPDLQVVTRRVRGAPVRVALRGTFPFRVADFADAAASVVAAEHRVWGERPRPFLVAVAPLDTAGGRRDIYGSGRGDAFSLATTTNVDLTAEARFLAHEMLHRWVPGALGGLPEGGPRGDDPAVEAADYWFSEGFTEYLAARTLVGAGQWTLGRWAAALDTVLRRNALSPARALPNATAAARHWRDPEVGQLAYDRGHLLAYRLDAVLHAHTNGRTGLEAVLRTQREVVQRAAARGDARVPAAARFPAMVRAVAGPAAGADVEALVRRHVSDGEPVTLTSADFGGCVRVEAVTGPAFARGFDAAATQAAGGVLAGVDSASTAFAAGLRNGQRWVRRDSGRVGDPSVAYVVRVADGAGERTVRYLPARTATWSRVVLEPVDDPARRQACAARLGSAGAAARTSARERSTGAAPVPIRPVHAGSGRPG
jgi:predicted metalloprotease with PDZ domain